MCEHYFCLEHNSPMVHWYFFVGEVVLINCEFLSMHITHIFSLLASMISRTEDI